MSLAEKTCQPCTGKIPPMTSEQIDAMLKELDGWQCRDGQKITKTFKFDDFKKAMELAKKIAVLADEQNHHPDLIVRWGELVVEIWTHASKGLTENDFILAAKIDRCASV